MKRRDFIKGTSASLAIVLVGQDLLGCTAKKAQVKGAKPEAWHMSVCPYCGVGCGLDVGVAKNKVVAVRGMKDHPVNRGEFCLLARNLVQVVDTDDRLLQPMRRNGSGFDKINWDTATTEIAGKLKAIINKHGPDSVAMYVSASEYIEEYYIYNKFMKGCLGTNNLESSARLCWASGVVGLVKAFGADSPPCSYDDFDHSDLFFVAGYNLSSSKPIVFKRMMVAKAKRKTPMIVIDPRKTDTATRADLHLQLRPGTDVALHNAIAHVLIRDGLIDVAEAKSITENYDALAAHVAQFTPAKAAAITGLTAAEIEKAAKMIGAAKAGLFMWGQGLNQSSIGTRKVTTLLNLVFITNNVSKPGAGPMAITGQSSAMALREVGALPHLLPGFRVVTDATARADIAKIWGVDAAKISAKKGKPIPMILEAIDSGKIKALWVIHSNPAATFPDTNWVRKVLAKTELLIVQDCYHPTETTRYGHYLLPGAQWAEKAGTLTNSERGLNLIEQAVTPPGQAKPDLDIVIDVAKKMGFADQFKYANTEAIFEEYKRCVVGRPCDISGVTYARLRKDKGIQWPVPRADHPGTKRRFVDRKFPKGKVKLNLYEHREPIESPDAAYPLVLITGLIASQFHSRTRTAKVKALQRAAPEPIVDLHPADAKTYGIGDGDNVDVSSRRGTVRVKARVTTTMRKGSVFLPYHFGYQAGETKSVNSLTNRAYDEFAKQPEYKACAVKVTKA